jgi:hypothetical protein
MSAIHTVSYYHNYDKDKIDRLESDPSIQIISRETLAADTTVLLPLHLEPQPAYLLYYTTYTYRVKSPSEDALMKEPAFPGSFNRGPKTLGDTNEFISAFWVNGKPKCRQGYRYDFRRKMCRRI